MEPGEYESIRRRNLEDNKRILAEFGLLNPFRPVQCIVKRSNKRPVVKAVLAKKRSYEESEDFTAVGSFLYGTRRKSARLSGQEAGAGLDLGSTYDELDEAEKKKIQTPVDRPNFYGPVPGVDVGTEWATRMECNKDGIHRPTVAGIHGGVDGAYSIALSGGYEDDVDLGDCFTYTGEGGRDLKGTKANPKNLRTAPQSKDQTLTRGNLALSRNVETGNPVRVIRGYKLTSQFAPEEGYRYDGIYTVEKCWFTTGMSGFGVWKFALKRCSNQAPPPWTLMQESVSPKKPPIADEVRTSTEMNSCIETGSSDTATKEEETLGTKLMESNKEHDVSSPLGTVSVSSVTNENVSTDMVPVEDKKPDSTISAEKSSNVEEQESTKDLRQPLTKLSPNKPNATGAEPQISNDTDTTNETN